VECLIRQANALPLDGGAGLRKMSRIYALKASMITQRDESGLSIRLLSNQEAADFLHLSPRTLEKLRVVGGGPPFLKLGRRVVYAAADLEAWAQRRRCDSTSDPNWKKP
jgi:Helix-turn-helix domain